MNLKGKIRAFPGGPGAKTLSFQIRQLKFNLRSENYIPYAATKSLHAATKTWQSQINIFQKVEQYDHYR